MFLTVPKSQFWVSSPEQKEGLIVAKTRSNKTGGPLRPGPHGLSRQEVESVQRERLLLAMADAVGEKGYANTSVADVLERARISRATFYALFKDKEDCFLATYEEGAKIIAQEMARAFGRAVAEGGQQTAGGRDPLELLDRVLSVYLNTLAIQRNLARTFLVEVYAAGPEAIKQRLRSMELFQNLVAEIFRGQPGLLGTEPNQRFAVEMLVNAVSAMVTNLVGIGEYARLRELKEPMMNLARELMETFRSK